MKSATINDGNLEWSLAFIYFLIGYKTTNDIFVLKLQYSANNAFVSKEKIACYGDII